MATAPYEQSVIAQNNLAQQEPPVIQSRKDSRNIQIHQRYNQTMQYNNVDKVVRLGLRTMPKHISVEDFTTIEKQIDVPIQGRVGESNPALEFQDSKRFFKEQIPCNTSSALINVPILERPSISSISQEYLTDENNYKELCQINHSLFPQSAIDMSQRKPERTLRDFFQQKSRCQKEFFTLNLTTPILRDFAMQSRVSVAENQVLATSSKFDPYCVINEQAFPIRELQRGFTNRTIDRCKTSEGLNSLKRQQNLDFKQYEQTSSSPRSKQRPITAEQYKRKKSLQNNMTAKIGQTIRGISTNYQTHSDGFSTFHKSKSIGGGTIARQKLSVFDRISTLDTNTQAEQSMCHAMNPSVNIHQISKIVNQQAFKRKRMLSRQTKQSDDQLYETIKEQMEGGEQADENKIQNKFRGIMHLQKRFNRISNDFITKKQQGPNVLFQISGNIGTSNRMIPMSSQQKLQTQRQKQVQDQNSKSKSPKGEANHLWIKDLRKQKLSQSSLITGLTRNQLKEMHQQTEAHDYNRYMAEVTALNQVKEFLSTNRDKISDTNKQKLIQQIINMHKKIRKYENNQTLQIQVDEES